MLWFSVRAQRFVLGAFRRASAIENVVFSSGSGGPSSYPAMKMHAQTLNPTFRSQNAAGRFGRGPVRDRDKAQDKQLSLPVAWNDKWDNQIFDLSWLIRWKDSPIPCNLSFER